MIKVIFILAAAISASYGSPTKNKTEAVPRITGGNTIDISYVPWQLFLLISGDESRYCGATLISPKWAVTAAHCVVGIMIYIQVRAGSSNSFEGGQVVNVTNFVRHPLYDCKTFDYDVAVLELEKEITIAPAAPVELIEANAILEEGSYGLVSGWGKLHENDLSIQLYLRMVEIPIVNPNMCRYAFEAASVYRPGRLTDRMLCAGFIVQGGKSACRGDSGGPLIVGRKLVGVTSWAYGCGIQIPGVYAAIANPQINYFIKKTAGLLV